MNNYEISWNERKGFLLSSLIIGSIASLVIVIWAATSMEFNSIGDVFEAVLALVFFALFFTAIVIIVRMIKNGAGEGFAINMLNGLWTLVINTFTGSWLGIVIGLFMIVVFFWLFMIVAAIYAIYFPISTIYIYVMYKKQIASKGSSNPSELKEF